MNTLFATVYASNVLDRLIHNEVSDLNEYGLTNPIYWNPRSIINTAEMYLCTHTRPKHPHADDMMEYIDQARMSDDDEDYAYCANAVVSLMTEDETAKQYLDIAYAITLRSNPSTISAMVEEDKVQGAISMMYDGFFDMCLHSETVRPTEFVEIKRYGDTSSNTFFLADTIDKILEIAKVGEGDTYALGRADKNANYLELYVSREDGMSELHCFIPVKWVRKVATTDFFMKSLIPADTINDFYRKGLQK